MSELLTAASAALGLPESLVQRSAAARAAETGATVDEVLTAWAGGGEIAAAATPAAPTPATPAPAPPPADEPSPPSPPAEEEEEAEVAVTAAVTVEAPPAAAQVTTRAPVPDRVTTAEAARLHEVVTVPTAGIRERSNFVIPKWLTAVLIVAPLFALFALGGASTGACGEATELATDVVTGDIVNCDGSEFTGQSVGGDGTDYIALGREIYTGTAVTGVNCAGCHGANGQGTGTFPALAGVLTTFSACGDHVEWVGLGSGGFQGAGESSYGDTNKPIAGGMPGFTASLTDEQIAAVSAFERARFGGGDRDEVLIGCGLVEVPEGGEEGTPPTEGGGENGGEDSGEASAIHSG